MNVVLDNVPTYWSGFVMTLFLSGVAGVCALIMGLALAAARVCPVAPLRFLSTAYIEVVKNTPLTLMFFFCVVVLPRLGVSFQQFTPAALIALSCYTAAFLCEAIRSGINSVPLGQAEAARSIGLTFSQTLLTIVVPQALRNAIAPVINIIIALVKNSSVAGGFYVNELFNAGRTLSANNGNAVVWVLLGVCVFYLFLTIPLGLTAHYIERKLSLR